MARMSREFNLVLLGAGLLTAGSFLIPDEDPVKRADEEARNGGGGSSRRARTGGIFIFTSYTRTTTNPVTSAASSRGGFGRIGGAFSGS
jgi:hypothetical protein